MTDDLTALLQRAAKHIMTYEEVFEQRVSWVYGQLMDSQPDLTKEQIRKVLKENEGYTSRDMERMRTRALSPTAPLTER